MPFGDGKKRRMVAYGGLILALVASGFALVNQVTTQDTKNDLANQVDTACRINRADAEAKGLNCEQAAVEKTTEPPNPVTVTLPPSIITIPEPPVVVTATEQVPLPFPSVTTVELPGSTEVRTTVVQQPGTTSTSTETVTVTQPPQTVTQTQTQTETSTATTTTTVTCGILDPSQGEC